MKKLVFITDIGFKEKDLSKFGIEYLKKKFDVKILDITKLSNFKFLNNKKICDEQIILNEWEDLQIYFKNNTINFAIDFVSNYETKKKLFKILKLNKISTGYWQNHITLKIKKTIKERIINFFFTFLDLKRIKAKIRFSFFKKDIEYFKYDFLLSCGPEGLKYDYISSNTKIIKAHSLEYENLKNNFSVPKNFNQEISVFLDQFLPFHPDAIFVKKFNPKTTEKKYFPALNKFFDDFEKSTNTKVVIAAHPKSDYENRNCWDSRKFIKNDSLDLVKNSKFVLAHQSTSLSYAVLLKKKIIFLTSNEYIRSYDNFTVHGYSRYFNMPLFNIDDYSPNDILKNLNKAKINKYEDYVKNYIKYNLNDTRGIWEILSDELNNNK